MDSSSNERSMSKTFGVPSSNVPYLLSRILRDPRKGLERFPQSSHPDDEHCRVRNQVEGLFLGHFEKPVERHSLECLLIPKIVLVLPDPENPLLYGSGNSLLDFCCQLFASHSPSWWSNENMITLLVSSSRTTSSIRYPLPFEISPSSLMVARWKYTFDSGGYISNTAISSPTVLNLTIYSLLSSQAGFSMLEEEGVNIPACHGHHSSVF